MGIVMILYTDLIIFMFSHCKINTMHYWNNFLDEDIEKNLGNLCLPRNLDDSNMVLIEWKRMKKLKRNVLSEWIRPLEMKNAVEKLKVEHKNPHYANINLNNNFSYGSYEEDDEIEESSHLKFNNSNNLIEQLVIQLNYFETNSDKFGGLPFRNDGENCCYISASINMLLDARSVRDVTDQDSNGCGALQLLKQYLHKSQNEICTADSVKQWFAEIQSKDCEMARIANEFHGGKEPLFLEPTPNKYGNYFQQDVQEFLSDFIASSPRLKALFEGKRLIKKICKECKNATLTGDSGKLESFNVITPSINLNFDDCSTEKERKENVIKMKKIDENTQKLHELSTIILDGTTSEMKGRNTSFCNICQSQKEFMNEEIYARLPKLLLVAVKRFNASGRSKWKVLNKINPSSNVTMECINEIEGVIESIKTGQVISSHEKMATKKIRYKLKSLIQHHGTDISGGHYTCAMKDQINENWIITDDRNVSQTSANQLKGYVFLYEKQNDLEMQSENQKDTSSDNTELQNFLDNIRSILLVLQNTEWTMNILTSLQDNCKRSLQQLQILKLHQKHKKEHLSVFEGFKDIINRIEKKITIKKEETKKAAEKEEIPDDNAFEGMTQLLEQLEEEGAAYDSEMENDEDVDMLSNVKKFQSNQNSNTFMTERNPEELVVENNTEAPLRKKKRSKAKPYIIAPGENKKLSNLCRTPHYDTRSHPSLHPSGNYGIHHPRDIPIPMINYYNQRLFNKDRRFAKSMSYIFMAHHVIERNILENQINMAGQKGKYDPDSSEVIHLSDAYSVLQRLKGTPKYWQQTRSELVAKVEQLGPFHIFFTLSCADRRWTEIFSTLLKLNKGDSIKIDYVNNPTKDYHYCQDLHNENCVSDDDDESVTEDEKKEGHWSFCHKNIIVETILSNGEKERIPLMDYIADKCPSAEYSQKKLLEDEVVIITRIFDNRVKAFVKNILLSKDNDRIPVEYYTYRVEFQAR